MYKNYFLLLCTLWIVQVKGDLAGEAKNQLEELDATVRGAIATAHDDIDSLALDYQVLAYSTIVSGQISIETQHDNILAQVETINSLANAAGKNVTACIFIRVELLKSLARHYPEVLKDCILTKDEEGRHVVDNSRYIVDIAINHVHRLDFQLNQCNGNLLCIAPVVREIELDLVKLPEGIKTEVNAVTGSITYLRLEIGRCSDEAISIYAASAEYVFQEMAACANNILS